MAATRSRRFSPLLFLLLARSISAASFPKYEFEACYNLNATFEFAWRISDFKITEPDVTSVPFEVGFLIEDNSLSDDGDMWYSCGYEGNIPDGATVENICIYIGAPDFETADAQVGNKKRGDDTFAGSPLGHDYHRTVAGNEDFDKGEGESDYGGDTGGFQPNPFAVSKGKWLTAKWKRGYPYLPKDNIYEQNITFDFNRASGLLNITESWWCTDKYEQRIDFTAIGGIDVHTVGVDCVNPDEPDNHASRPDWISNKPTQLEHNENAATNHEGTDQQHTSETGEWGCSGPVGFTIIASEVYAFTVG
ncbi:hypothetical protein V8F20_005436 [Naviculisporaceae sp. PSN 640]